MAFVGLKSGKQTTKGKNMNIRRALFALGAVFTLSSPFISVTPAQAQAVTCVPSNPNNAAWPTANSTMVCSNSAKFNVMRSTLEAIGTDGSDAASRLQTQGTVAGDQVSITIFDDTTQQIIGTVGIITTIQDTPKTIADRIADNANTQYSTELFAYTQGLDIYIFSYLGHEISHMSHQSGSNGITLTVTAQSAYGISGTVGGSARNDITWWEFGSPAGFTNCTLGASGCPTDNKPSLTPLGSGVYAITWGGVNGAYTANFEHSTGGGIADVTLKHTTAHETGHQLDDLYGLAGFGGAVNQKFSATTAFRNAVQRDLDLMALIPTCNFQASNGHTVFGDPPVRTGGVYANADENGNPLPTGGSAGFFSYENDRFDSPICDDRTSVYPGNNTVEVMKNAFTYFDGVLDPNAVSPREGELFAEIYAAAYAGGSGFPDTVDDDGNPHSPGNDRLFNNWQAFKCTRLYVQSLVMFGRMPTTYELTYEGYSIPGIISGAPVDNGMYGYGSTNFYCDGSSQYQGDYAWGS
ncbi:MAG: hypothetical protein C0464_01415 [Cyanobacteria bacterium DS2.008]|nr:hypothetical protein [Cyanobacteria bacterium DS2.008]